MSGHFRIRVPSIFLLHHLALSTTERPRQSTDKRLGFRGHLVRVLPATTLEDTDLGVVNATIRLMPFDVFVAIFERGDTPDDEQRKDDETRGDGVEFVEELKDGNGEEEAVKICLVSKSYVVSN